MMDVDGGRRDLRMKDKSASASTVFDPLVEFLQYHTKGWIRLKFHTAAQSFRDASLFVVQDQSKRSQ
jgi:hypothetical protein